MAETMKAIDFRLQDGVALAAPYLSVSGLSKRFGTSTVVDGVSFEAAKSEFICVLGPSGCGKTTLLRLIAGFERANAGSIVQDGLDITSLSPESRDFGIVFQSYALFPNRDVAGNIAFGLEAAGIDRASRYRRVQELLTLVGLESHASKFPSQLSGGQQQRVALARALALSPGLLLLDEPLSALDANVRVRLRLELLALQRRVGVTALMVTHDQQEALAVADRIIVMNQGKIEQSGRPDEVFEKPANLFVARFLGEMNAFVVDAVEGDRYRAGPFSMLRAEPTRAVSSKLQLCIRPSAVLLGPEAISHDGAVAGRVSHVQYFGDMVRLTLQLRDHPGVEIDAELPRVRLGRLPRQGDEMDIALPSKHLHILTDNAGP